MTSDQRLRLDAVNRWGETTGAALARYVVPIYGQGPRHPETVGSGVLLHVCGQAVLATAAHVLDEIRVRALSFGAAETILPIGGWRSATRVPEGGSRDDDRVDLAFVRLSRPAAAYLTESDLLDVKALEVRRTLASRHRAEYFVVGYPATRQPRQMKDDEYEARPFTFVSNEASEPECSSGQVDRRSQLLVDFRKEDVFRDGDPVAGPDLPGLSGGAIWRLPARQGEVPMLAGIATAWRKVEPYGILATRSAILLDFLAARFPSLANLHRLG